MESCLYLLSPCMPFFCNPAGQFQTSAGIYVGGSKVVHFTREKNTSSDTDTSPASNGFSSKLPSSCSTFPDCGFRQPNSGVVLSCLDCFLGSGSLYCFEYGVAPSVFLAKVRGGTCTTAESDPSETVIHRAMYLLQNGFGNYDVFQNNCEDFALYCKTGLLVAENASVGRSGQASSFIGAPLAAILSSPLKLFMAGPVGVATVTAGMYCVSRYATDIGVRTDVIKVPVEDLSVNLGWMGSHQEVAEEREASKNGRMEQQTSR
ncbi:protein LEAD-SENSITIVE 1 isoform X2 [Magnolia sinica]|uniref:protein LEAD-SENSITIVE 1 isoform X2 n=1 Tax=Magnolia sinica TaxID=86752 RepID=UPI00265A1858|nr:protein LEAD-SENSITIVE 1 isoform X2 [Magnolia sinica]